MTVPSQDQIDAFRDAFKKPSISEWMRNARLLEIACFLQSQSFYLKRDSHPAVRNIQPLDCDQLAELFEAIAKRIVELSPTDSFHSKESATSRRLSFDKEGERGDGAFAQPRHGSKA